MKGDYIIEGSLELPSRTLLVARALVDATRKKLPCRVLNPSDKTITLRFHTPIGELSPVTLASVSAIRRRPECRRPSIGDMRAILEDKQISLADTSVTGRDLDNLIVLLYDNLE